MFKNRIHILAMALILTALGIGPCYALDSLIANINQAAAIVNPADPTDVRALLRFDLPTELDTTKFVTYAELRFGVNTTGQFEHPIRLRINPLTSAWTPGNIGWSAPWSRSGGDFADTIGSIGHIDTVGQFVVKIDIANIIQDYIRGYYPNHGIIIRQHGSLRRAFNLVQNRYPGGAVAQLAIYYIDLDPDD
jgi:hypothetical protein